MSPSRWSCEGRPALAPTETEGGSCEGGRFSPRSRARSPRCLTRALAPAGLCMGYVLCRAGAAGIVGGRIYSGAQSHTRAVLRTADYKLCYQASGLMLLGERSEPERRPGPGSEISWRIMVVDRGEISFDNILQNFVSYVQNEGVDEEVMTYYSNTMNVRSAFQAQCACIAIVQQAALKEAYIRRRQLRREEISRLETYVMFHAKNEDEKKINSSAVIELIPSGQENSSGS